MSTAWNCGAQRATICAAAVTLVLAGCGGATTDRGTTEAATRGTLVAGLGDSITAGSPLWDPDPATRAGIGPAATPESQYEHWVAEALDGEVRFRNCGVFGERTDEIARRLDTCIEGVDRIIIQGGINDIAQGRPVTDAAAEIEDMVSRARAAGTRPILVDVLPWNNGYPDAAPAIDELNRLIDEIGAEADVPVVAFYDSLEDPRAAGRMADEWTIDGDHPSVEGYRRLGLLVAEELRNSL